MPRGKVDGWRQLLPELLKSELLSGHSLPNIRRFIEENNDLLKTYIFQHPCYNNGIKKLDLLWINLFINPDILFCHKDSVENKFSHYFAPIMLTSDTAEVREIKKLHHTFYKHYSTPKEKRKFYTFSDLHPDFQLTDIITPPAPEQMVGITYDNTLQKISLHPDSHYEGALQVINKSEAKKKKFNNYVKKVTCTGKWAYYIYSAGYRNEKSNGEFGRAYLAYRFKHGQACCLSKTQFSSLKNICFDLLSMFALAGALIRNKPVFETMNDLKEMMDRMNKHQDLLRQFGGRTLAEGNREELSEIWKLSDKRLSNLPSNLQIDNVRNHITECTTCDGNQNIKNFMHAITDAADAEKPGCQTLYYVGLKKDLVEKIKTMRSSKIGSFTDINLEPWADALFQADFLTDESKRKKLFSLRSCKDRYIKALSLLLTEEVVSSNLNKLGLKINDHDHSNNLKIIFEELEDNIAKLEIAYTVTGSNQIASKDKEIVINREKAKPDSLSYVLLFADCFFSDVKFKVITNLHGTTTKASFISGSIPAQSEPTVSDNYCLYSFILKI